MRGQASQTGSEPPEFIAMEWGHLAVWTSGTGSPLMAIHGLGGSGRYWFGLSSHLDGRRLISPDLAGFGWSDSPPLRYDRRFHLDNLTAVVDGLVPRDRPLDLVGHSLGGLLAALWALEHPSRVSSLALISVPFPDPSLVPRLVRDIAQRAPDDRGWFTTRLSKTLWPVLGALARRSGRFPKEVVDDFARQSLGARADTLWSLAGDPTVTGELAGLTDLSSQWPLLYLVASEDRYIDAESLARWRQIMPDGQFRQVPRGGHQFLLRQGFDPLAAWVRELDKPV